MRATLISLAAAIAVIVSSRAWAQEVVASPAPATAVTATEPVVARVVVRPDQWRYRWYGNRWWYWTPENHWVWYGDTGWTTYVPAPAPYVAYRPAYVYPDPGYPYGYYPYGYYYGPRVAVGWGPRGFVRAGRWGVYW